MQALQFLGIISLEWSVLEGSTEGVVFVIELLGQEDLCVFSIAVIAGIPVEDEIVYVCIGVKCLLKGLPTDVCGVGSGECFDFIEVELSIFIVEGLDVAWFCLCGDVCEVLELPVGPRGESGVHKSEYEVEFSVSLFTVDDCSEFGEELADSESGGSLFFSLEEESIDGLASERVGGDAVVVD